MTAACESVADACLVYEVNLDVEAAIADDYRAWLRAHAEQMLALPGFESATMFDVIEPVGEERVGFCVHYRLRDTTSLDNYLRDHAARMRSEGIERFGDRFRASRRVLCTSAGAS